MGGTGEPLIYFGNLSRAVIVGIRNNIRLIESKQRYLSADQIAYRAVLRFDAVAHSVGDSSTSGPVVCLLGA